MSYDKNTDFYAIQNDVLTENLTSNPSIKKLKQMKTPKAFITGAINYLHDQITSASYEAAEANRKVSKIQKEVMLAADDFEDTFSVPADKTQSVFKLTHKPIGKLRLYIDGIRYFKDTFTFNSDTNEVTWINTDQNHEGFEITDSDVVVEYDYDKQEDVQNG